MHGVDTAKAAAEQNARMPEYYVMRRGVSMPATVAAEMPGQAYMVSNRLCAPRYHG
jgi:hypothetical protein